jgi:hypothetical protein
MADKATLYPPLRGQVASCDSICLTCAAVVVCPGAKAA